MSLLASIKTWIDGADWRSWLTHSLAALPIAALTMWLGNSAVAVWLAHLLTPGGLAGVWSVFCVFAMREIEQRLLKLAAGVRPHPTDDVLDVVFPVAAVILLVALLA